MKNTEVCNFQNLFQKVLGSNQVDGFASKFFFHTVSY
jgi:hypothetical protein